MTYDERYAAESARWSIHCLPENKCVVTNCHACMMGDNGVNSPPHLVTLSFIRKRCDSLAKAQQFIHNRATAVARSPQNARS
jgi:hypothetical protein